MTLRRRWALNSSMPLSFETSRRRGDQPVPRSRDVGEQFHGLCREGLEGLGVGVAPGAADGRIAQNGDVVAAMRRVDRGCRDRLIGDQPATPKTAGSRNDVVKQLIGVAGRLLPI